jgi:thioredoxin-related protein
MLCTAGGTMKKTIILILFTLFAMGCVSDNAIQDNGEIPTNYSETETDTEVMYFGATWCGPCKKMKQLFKDKDVKKELDRLDMKIYDVDVDKELAKSYNIQSIPTLIIKDENQLKRYVGSMGKEELLQILRGVKK